MKLSDLAQGRDNNFNLIRIVAAMAVLITHSFAVAAGSSDAEPFRERLGMTMGSIGVDVFFVTSGFLVTASLVARQDVLEFACARILRIFPALVVMLIFTVFGVGTFFTSQPPASYLANHDTYFYLLKCATLITGVAEGLPGVFEGNPYKNTVNGSLWTMPYEIRMYLILAIMWVVLRVAKKGSGKIFQLATVAACVVAGAFVIVRHFYFPPEGQFGRLFFMFFTGASFYVLREHIRLSGSCFWLAVMTLTLSVLVNRNAFFVVYQLTIAYVLFYLAYIPSGYVRKYNQLGDYSYGIYIYAFPIQQSVAAMVAGISILSMVLISASVTLLLAALSWHLLERRALTLKALYVGYTRRILACLPTGAVVRTR